MPSIDDILKAKKYITNLRDGSQVVLDGFKKEIEANEDEKTSFITLTYDNRIKNCNTILEILEKQIPKQPIMERWNPALCPACGEELSESIGDGYYKHLYNVNVCNCGQKIMWEEE